MLVKEPGEVALDWLVPLLANGLRRCWLLVPPESFEAYTRAMAGAPPHLDVLRFDPAGDDLQEVLSETLEASEEAAPPTRLITIAPYFALKASDSPKAATPGGPTADPIRRFANNYSCQGIKLKGCKPLLDRAGLQLSVLGELALESCPFLTLHDDVQVADLSPIPEKYRLDHGRAESLLCAWLESWLEAISGSPSTPTPARHPTRSRRQE
jgi:hypothetical protein